MTHQRLRCGAFFVLMVLLIVRPVHAAGKKEYVCGVYFSSAVFGAAQLLDMAQKALTLVEKETGTSWSLKKYPSFEDARDAFLRGEIHATFLNPHHIDTVIKSGVSILPWAGYRVAGQDKAGECLWHAKSMKFDAPGDIHGKSLIMPYYNVLPMLKLRENLYENGINKPLWEVFSSFTKVGASVSGLMAVAMGKVDLTWRSDEYSHLLKVLNPSAAGKLAVSFCTKPVYERGMIVFNAEKITPGEYNVYHNSLKTLLKDIQKPTGDNAANRSVIKMLKSAGAELVTIDPPVFKAETALYEKAKKNGWLKEAEFIEKIMSAAEPGKAVVIKP